jgi:hypothetical protein
MWVAYEAATVLKGTKHWHSHDNFIKRVNTFFLFVFIVILVMKAVTVRCGVRIGQAVIIKYIQIKHKIIQTRSGQCSDNAISPVAWNKLAVLTSGRICDEMSFLRPVRKNDVREKVDRHYRIQKGAHLTIPLLTVFPIPFQTLHYHSLYRITKICQKMSIIIIIKTITGLHLTSQRINFN